MPNILGPNGLETATYAELQAYFTAQYQTIYGSDINLASDTPDGQMMNIFIQSILDLEDLLTQVYNQFDPDNAIGKVLDQRVAINGIQRQAGTHTVTNIDITTTQAVTLYGIDQSSQPAYTVQDNAGNRWQLLVSTVISGAGVNTLAFQAEVPGAVLSVPNTITVPVSIILGVSAINNPTTYTTLGLNEESDADLKVRRQKSVSLSSQGYLAGLLAALENISGVSSAFVYENVTGVTDGDGIPSHSIWVIVSGTGNPAAIANAIYTKRNAGCGMKGAQTFTVVQADGTNFVLRWDIVVPETLFIKFTASSLDGINVPNYAGILDYLVNHFIPGVAAQVNINDLATDVQLADNNCLVTNSGFCLTVSGSYTPTLTPTAKNQQFAVSQANIIILPILITPATDTIAVNDTIQFSAIGGHGTLTYTMQSSGSGSPSVGSLTGLYTAGASPGTDVVRVTDSLGNFSDATITVV